MSFILVASVALEPRTKNAKTGPKRRLSTHIERRKKLQVVTNIFGLWLRPDVAIDRFHNYLGVQAMTCIF